MIIFIHLKLAVATQTWPPRANEGRSVSTGPVCVREYWQVSFWYQVKSSEEAVILCKTSIGSLKLEINDLPATKVKFLNSLHRWWSCCLYLSITAQINFAFRDKKTSFSGFRSQHSSVEFSLSYLRNTFVWAQCVGNVVGLFPENHWRGGGDVE